MAIDKTFIKLKNDNRGISLIEILVTIAMILILAGPLINSLLNSRIVNSNARLTQNGTTVAQDMAEKFKTVPIEELCETYKDKYVVNATTGIYKFSDIQVNGPSGEKFTVDVTLDPTAYVAGNEGNKNPVNNEKLPGMSSIYGANCIKLYKYYTAADEKLKEMFRNKVNNTRILNNLYGEYRKGLSKDTTIDIKCWYSEATDRYEYNVELKMTYILDLASVNNGARLFNKPNDNGPGHGGDDDDEHQPASGVYRVTHTELIEGVSFSSTEDQLIYLICPIFDICNNNFGYCTDKISINYHFDDRNGGTQPDLHFYLAEQETYKKGSTTIKQKINPYNVKVNGLDLSHYNASTSKLKMCTNLTKPGGANLLDLTYEFKDSGIALYEMTVEVSEKDKVVAEFISTK